MKVRKPDDFENPWLGSENDEYEEPVPDGWDTQDWDHDMQEWDEHEAEFEAEEAKEDN